MPYVFYDTETTGLDSRFDQILQFSAIYTDESFVEIESIDTRCRLQPHIVPSATALAVSHTPIEQCRDTNLPSHNEMVGEIYAKLLEWSPAVFAGWNSIRFDEEFLRSAFYQTLRPAFVTSMNENSRLDILRIAQVANVFAPGSLSVSSDGKGKQSYALERLAPNNGFRNHEAHNALSDVRATIYLAQLLKERAPAVWSQSVRFAKKKSAMDFLSSAEPLIVNEAYKGQNNQYPVVRIGNDPKITGNIFAADLTRDFDGFLNLEADQQLKWMSASPRPVRLIKCNASPSLMPFDDLDTFKDFDLDELVDVAENLTSNEALCSILSEVFLAVTTRQYENTFVEQQIYEEFATNETLSLLETFHSISWNERYSFLSQIPDKRYQKLGLRLIFEHAPDSLATKSKDMMISFIHGKILGDAHSAPPWRTIDSAREDLHCARSDSRFEHHSDLFNKYEAYLDELEAEHSVY